MFDNLKILPMAPTTASTLGVNKMTKMMRNLTILLFNEKCSNVMVIRLSKTERLASKKKLLSHLKHLRHKIEIIN